MQSWPRVASASICGLTNAEADKGPIETCSLREHYYLIPLQLSWGVSPLQEHVMRPLRYSINVTLDGCCDHRAIPADEELHRHAVENLDQADALLFGRVTYEMMEAAFRPPARTGARPDWMEPFARTIDAAKKYVVSSS